MKNFGGVSLKLIVIMMITLIIYIDCLLGHCRTGTNKSLDSVYAIYAAEFE